MIASAPMPQLLVRNVPLDVVEALKRQAARHGRSAEAEHRAILEGALKAGRASFRTTAATLREETRGRIRGESADLIREDRDRR
jgi:plasmid stability protein